MAGTEKIEREIEKLKARLRSNNGSHHEAGRTGPDQD